MQAWSLERVPPLDTRALTAILQSITQSTLGQTAPLSLCQEQPSTFAPQSWQDLGCDSAALTSIYAQYGAMFSVQTPPPAVDSSPAALVNTVQLQWQDGQRLLTFFTSGSTGTPKPCTHREILVRQEITGIAPLFPGRAAALVTAPLHHMYGFTFGLLLPRALGIPIRTLPPLPSVVIRHIRTQDLVVGIPLLWKHLAEMQSTPEVRDVMGLTATAPTATEVFEHMQGKGFSMIEFFGASETGAMCWRTEARAPFTLLPHFTHDEAMGNTTVMRTLPDQSQQHYTLLDAIDWHNPRQLLPIKRVDDAVQVAGHNVFPDRVATVLSQHADVAECSVRLMHPDEGNRLKAFIVPKAGVDTQSLHKSLRTFAQANLTKPEQPVSYTFGDDLPRSLTGKPTTWSLFMWHSGGTKYATSMQKGLRNS